MVTQSVKVADFRVDENMDSSLRGISSYFEPGEYGEIIFRLDRAKASTAGQVQVREDVAAFSEQLRDQGMRPWPGRELATLDWTNRKIRVRFIETNTPASMYMTPSFIGLALLGARGVAMTAPIVATRTGFIFGLWRGLRTVGAKLRALASGLTRSRAIAIAGTGLLVWSLIDMDSLVEVFKYVGGKARDLVMTPLIIGAAVMAVGFVFISRGK